MNRPVLVLCFAMSACVVKEAPPPNQPQPQPQPQPTAPAPTPVATTTPTATPTASPTPTGTGPIGMPSPTGMPTGMPTGVPTGMPAPGGLPTLPGVCIPIGNWTKKFDNGIPAAGTVTITNPVVFNQFPVADGVVLIGAPLGTLKARGR